MAATVCGSVDGQIRLYDQWAAPRPQLGGIACAQCSQVVFCCVFDCRMCNVLADGMVGLLGMQSSGVGCTISDRMACIVHIVHMLASTGAWQHRGSYRGCTCCVPATSEAIALWVVACCVLATCGAIAL